MLSKADELNLILPTCCALKVVLEAMRGAGAHQDELREILDIGISISYNIFPTEPGALSPNVEALVGLERLNVCVVIESGQGLIER